MNIEHELREQVIENNDFISFRGLIPAKLLAFRYVMDKPYQRLTIDIIQKLDYTSAVLEPALKKYLLNKEYELGRSRKSWTEEEKDEAMKEMETIYDNFKERGLVY